MQQLIIALILFLSSIFVSKVYGQPLNINDVSKKIKKNEYIQFNNPELDIRIQMVILEIKF